MFIRGNNKRKVRPKLLLTTNKLKTYWRFLFSLLLLLLRFRSWNLFSGYYNHLRQHCNSLGGSQNAAKVEEGTSWKNLKNGKLKHGKLSWETEVIENNNNSKNNNNNNNEEQKATFWISWVWWNCYWLRIAIITKAITTTKITTTIMSRKPKVDTDKIVLIVWWKLQQLKIQFQK